MFKQVASFRSSRFGETVDFTDCEFRSIADFGELGDSPKRFLY
ncbi:MAG: hypothetical protein IPJ30_15245 [Acidobacteria bacterium]|nr:hypothetical protein [Acidobacteriota bacterium]